ncbi:MAG: MmgE/PrpD family protein [Microcella sp.]|nr:MmgE/PrpD family protein [Microcella sp.]
MNQSENLSAGEPGYHRASVGEEFGRFCADFDLDTVPEAVLTSAALHILDTVGVGIGAAVLPGEADSARAALAVVQESTGASESSAYGLARKVSAPAAALANASLQHSLDFDDIHTDSRVHTSTMTVPAALALAERLGSTGRDVLAAVIVGNEVAARVGMGAPRHVQHYGFHGTPVCGVFGVAAGAAVLLGLDADQTAHALGIAADVAGGTNAWIAEGTSNKHLHAGWAAQNGIIAAQLAARGAKGPRLAFEGRFGFFDALGRASDVRAGDVVESLGQRWATAEIAYKAFPSCYWMHGSLGAAQQLRDSVLASLDQVTVLEAIVPSAAVALVLEPESTRLRPLTPYSAKFSLQYSVAAMIMRGFVDLTTYTTTAMHDEEILDLAARITWRVDPDLDAGEQLYAGGLRVVFSGGNERTIITHDPLGTVENPMSDGQIIDKFRSCASLGLGAEDVRLLEHLLLEIAQLPSVDAIGAVMRRVTAQ